MRLDKLIRKLTTYTDFEISENKHLWNSQTEHRPSQKKDYYVKSADSKSSPLTSGIRVRQSCHVCNWLVIAK